MTGAGSTAGHPISMTTEMPSGNFRDFESIVQLVIVALKRTPVETIAHIRAHRMDAFHTIPDPRNGSFLIVGAEVTERFRSIARRHLASQPDRKARTDRENFVAQLAKKFSEFFLQPEQTRPANESNMNRWIGSALRAAEKEHDAATHYIPCALIFSTTVKQFAVGPVTFYHTDEFFRLFGSEIEQLREKIRDRHRRRVEEAIKDGFPEKSAATPEQSAAWGNRLTDGLLNHYKGFNWFAVVQIPASHKQVSSDRALLATRGALNIIKLFLGAGYTDRLRTADDPGNAGPSATLTRDSQGELGISLTSVPIDNTVGEGWLDLLTGRFFERAARILTLCSAFGEPPPLCARFMDALHWFGEAVSEKSRAGRIVKFVTAIECICGTGLEQAADGTVRGVTDIVTTRAAILYSVLQEVSFDQARDEISRIYDCRSDLVHGTASPFDEEVATQVRRTYEVTRAVLFAALDYYGDRLEDPAMDVNGLKAAFQKLEQWNADGRPP